MIAATNVDLERAVKDGTFRGDLFFRLNVIPVKLPPLRDRLDDLPELAEFFLHRYNTRFHKQIKGIAESTIRMLSHYWWPGNIRELENLIERVVATCDGEWITDDDLPLDFHVAELDHQADDKSLLDRALATFERNYIIRALEKQGWNVTQTARYLGVPLSTLKFKIERSGIRGAAKASERRMRRRRRQVRAADAGLRKRRRQTASPFSNQGGETRAIFAGERRPSAA